MQDLLKPDWGVLALTVLNFALLVFLLAKFAWKPIIGALEKREQQVRTDKEMAEKARLESQSKTSTTHNNTGTNTGCDVFKYYEVHFFLLLGNARKLVRMNYRAGKNSCKQGKHIRL